MVPTLGLWGRCSELTRMKYLGQCLGHTNVHTQTESTLGPVTRSEVLLVGGRQRGLAVLGPRGNMGVKTD